MPNSPRFVLVTGLSGSGKSLALRVLEDIGFYCVDNIPAALIPTLAELAQRGEGSLRRFAVCVDGRAGSDLINLPAYLDEVRERGIQPEAVFLDCSNEVLIKRYSESRRRHPNAPDGNVEAGIQRERQLLDPIRARADLVVDTSATSVAELRERIGQTFHGPRKPKELIITFMSFGFKNGVPPEADLVMDVRFLPNPFYNAGLRQYSGNDPDVRDYVLNNSAAKEFLDRFQELLAFLIPRYLEEPKSYLTIAIGCTGGRHRSVAVAQELTQYVRGLDFNARLRHRDIERSTQ